MREQERGGMVRKSGRIKRQSGREQEMKRNEEVMMDMMRRIGLLDPMIDSR